MNPLDPTPPLSDREPLAHALTRAREHLVTQNPPENSLERVMAASALAMAERRNKARAMLTRSSGPAWLNRPVGAFRRYFGARPPGWVVGFASMAVAAVAIVGLTSSPPIVQAVAQAPLAMPELSFMPLESGISVVGGVAQPSRSEAATWLMPVEMPRAQLASFGLPFDPSQAAMPVRAEFLMSASGKPLAVRILP